MSVQNLSALLTAIAVVTGAVWAVINGRKQRAREDTAGLWDEAMDIIARLKEENDRLRTENTTLQTALDALRKRPVRSRATTPRGKP